MVPTSRRWRTALLMGLLVSIWSTALSQLAAGRIGRDPAVDWMVVAAIPLRDLALQAEPGWGVVLAGVLFHIWADLSWALVFFGLLGRWTMRLRPAALLLIAPVWAIGTSALEWSVLVPVMPFAQPVFTLNQPWWIGLLVHLSAALAYPLYPALRDVVAGVHRSPHRRFAAAWGGAAAMLLLGLAALGASRREWPPHLAAGEEAARGYMRRMAAHHEQGIALGLIGAARAEDAHLRALARLIVANQRGEVAVFRRWWRSWWGEELPPAISVDHATMPGMLLPEALQALRDSPRDLVDARFVQLMTQHHQGAVLMATQLLQGPADPRLRVMAHATRHAQRGEIELLHGIGGWDAVRAAWTHMFGAYGEVAADLR
jgi:uncharacterized protein (DUF305 family)